MKVQSLQHPAERLIRVDVPLQLRRSLRPLGGHFLDDGWWHSDLTPCGPATLHLRRQPQGVVARAWGPGTAWVLARVEAMIGLNDDPASLSTDHPLVGELARKNQGYRFGATGTIWSSLVRAIVGQKVTGKEAKRGMWGLADRFGEPAPGPGRFILPPDPERVAAAPYWQFHDIGIEKKRADTLRRAAAASPRLESLATAPSSDVRRMLHRIDGIGTWTSAETVAVSHGDADAVSVGDFHLKNVVAWHLTGKPRGTDEEMLELLEEFRPHRGRVVRLLSTLGKPPAYGPRLAPRSFGYR